MKFSLLTLFAFLLLVVSGMDASASVQGAEITYKCKGGGKYDVFVKTYRDCNGIPISKSNLKALCSTSVITVSVNNQTKISTKDITGISADCPTGTRCSGSYQYGYEEVVWQMELDLSGSSCCEWTLSWEQCCRDGGITTGQSGQGFLAMSMLNKCVSTCNNSPEFTNSPQILACQNQNYIFNMGAVDSDFCDSVSYTLVSGLTPTGSVTYTGNYSPTRPMGFLGFPNQNLSYPAGFHLDPLTGDLAFYAIGSNEMGTIVIEAKEWRKVNGVMMVIGYVRRDFVIKVISCSNKVPKILPPYSSQACAGEEICIQIGTDDDDAGDTVKISWNSGIAGATFTHNNGTVAHASGQVCWTPTKADICNSPYTFTILAKDNACPQTGTQTRAFSVFVREMPEAELYTEEFSCGRLALDHTITVTTQGEQFKYSILDETLKVRWTGTQKQDTAVLAPGRYFVRMQLQSYTPCIKVIEDTVVIGDYVQVDLPSDTLICAGDSIKLIGNISTGTGPFHYEWWDLDDSSDFGISINSFHYLPQKSGRIALYVVDSDGCLHSDSISFDYSPLPSLNLGPDLAFCKGDSIKIDAEGDSFVLYYLWSNSETTPSIQSQIPGNYSVIIKDIFGCSNYDTIGLFELNPEVIGAVDISVCRYDTVSLMASGSDSFLWYDQSVYQGNGKDIPLYNGSSPIFISGQSMNLVVIGFDRMHGTQCTAMDTMRLLVRQLPSLNIGADARICKGDSLGLQVQSNSAMFSIWSTGEITNSIWAKQAGVYWAKATDSVGCSNIDTMQLQVQVVPIEAGSAQAVCPNDSALLNASGADSYTWYDATTYQAGVSNTPISTQNPYKYAVTQSFQWLVEGVRTDNGLQCMDKDTLSVLVHSPTVIQIMYGSFQGLDSFQVYTYSVNPQGQKSFNWTVTNGTIVNGQGNSSISVKWNVIGTGTVRVEVESTEGCSSVLSATAEILGTGLYSPNLAQFRIYPNPSKGVFSLELQDESEDLSYQVINPLGQTLKSGPLYGKQNTLNLEGLPAGVYIIRIAGQGDVRVHIID